MDARVEGLGLGSIQEINALPRELAEVLYARLVPEELLDRFGIDPATLCDRKGARLVRVTAPADQPWARVEVRSTPEDRDPALLVDVEMSPLSVPELAFVQITDPAGARYAIDRHPDGRDTLFGTACRNIEEERRAMRDGLAPGQVRRGLRLLSRVLDAMEGFCALIGKEIYLIEPLFYHSAILYERRGCGYLMGRDVMESIHAGFGDGGALRKSLDPSSDFRAPEAARTVRGRSWAIHDGIGDGFWGGAGAGAVKMYKAAGRSAGINTFPGAIY
ncbi:MAG TPA: hypothetical protein VK878_11785 [Candidatus Deferrimicrobiaceae bacterium]|jgi:hypothetical protein|nr:hypothetical protein [Candidatus Deferrimicrobiaceae bacterium]